MRFHGGPQAIYPILIIVIVALKWSPLGQGFGDSILITDESGGHSPTHLRSFDRATMSNDEMTDTTHTVYVLGGQEMTQRQQ